MRDLQKTANDHDVREKMDHLISVSEVSVKEDRRCQGEHRKARRHLPHTKTKDHQQPTANFEGNGNCPAQRGQGQAHAADVRCRRSEGSELAEAAHEKWQTDKYATTQWQKSCNFHVRSSARCLRRLSGDREGDDLTAISRVISLYFTIVKYHRRWSLSMRTKASRQLGKARLSPRAAWQAALRIPRRKARHWRAFFRLLGTASLLSASPGWRRSADRIRLHPTFPANREFYRQFF